MDARFARSVVPRSIGDLLATDEAPTPRRRRPRKVQTVRRRP
jgi:hypothetical protein